MYTQFCPSAFLGGPSFGGHSQTQVQCSQCIHRTLVWDAPSSTPNLWAELSEIFTTGKTLTFCKFKKPPPPCRKDVNTWAIHVYVVYKWHTYLSLSWVFFLSAMCFCSSRLVRLENIRFRRGISGRVYINTHRGHCGYNYTQLTTSGKGIVIICTSALPMGFLPWLSRIQIYYDLRILWIRQYLAYNL